MIIDFDMANINKSNVPKWKWNDIQDYSIAFNSYSNSLSFVLPYYLETFGSNPLSIGSNYDCTTIEECCEKYDIACDCENENDCCQKYGLFCSPCSGVKDCCKKLGGRFCDCGSKEECCEQQLLYCDCKDAVDCCKKHGILCPPCDSPEDCCDKFGTFCDCNNPQDCCEKYGRFCDCETPEECCEKYGKFCGCENAEDCCKKYGRFCPPCDSPQDCCEKFGGRFCDCEDEIDCCKKYGKFCDCNSSEECCEKYGIFCDDDDDDICNNNTNAPFNGFSSISGIPSESPYNNPSFCKNINGCINENSSEYSIINDLVPEDFSKALNCCEKSSFGVTCGFICGQFDKIEVRGSSLIDDGWYTPEEIIDKMCSECTKKHILQKIVKEEDSEYYYFYLVNYDKYTNEECKRELIKKIPKKEDCIDKYFSQKIAEKTINVKCKIKVEGKIDFSSDEDYIDATIYIVANQKKICEFDLTDTETYVSIEGDEKFISLSVNQVNRNLVEVTENDDYDMFLEIYNPETGEDEKHYYKVEKDYNEIDCGGFTPKKGSNLIEVFYKRKKCVKIKRSSSRV